VRVLVTGGPTPVAIDAVRRLTNKFSGELGGRIAEELHLRGAEALLVHGAGRYQPPAHLPVRRIRSYDEYLETVVDELAGGYAAGVFTASVADYRPREVLPGKTPSGGALRLDLVPTDKVIRRVRERFPALHMTVFKYEEGVDHERLIAIARERLAEGYQAVVANRGEERGADGAQVAWLLAAGGGEPRRAEGKPAIARAVADLLETAPAAGR
jgi:phosphopantothenoylcysteine decarboxylase/phosphopantothenate--cysteine ligase